MTMTPPRAGTGIDYERLYSLRFADIDQNDRLAVWREIAPWVWRRMGCPERLLDPAAGLGEFINAAPAPERWAVDVHEYQDGTYDSGVRQITSDVFDLDLPDSHFDGVWISNFLEHLTTQENCGRFLRSMFEATAPGGRIAVMGPNFRYCAKEYFDFADHTLVFTHNAIVEHLGAAGYTVTEVVPRFLPFSFRSRLPASASLTARYLNTPLLWRAFGKQFLVIGERLSQ